MGKTEVYSWRLEPALKSELEEAARRREESLSSLLDGITRNWLRSGSALGGDEDRDRQRNLQEAASRYVGSVAGEDPTRAEESGRRIREKLRGRYDRAT